MFREPRRSIRIKNSTAKTWLLSSVVRIGSLSGSCVVPNIGQIGVQRLAMSTADYTESFVAGSSAVSRDSKCFGSSCERLGAKQRPRWPINRANLLMTRFKNYWSDVQGRARDQGPDYR